jgi:hypothetical protein
MEETTGHKSSHSSPVAGQLEGTETLENLGATRRDRTGDLLITNYTYRARGVTETTYENT